MPASTPGKVSWRRSATASGHSRAPAARPPTRLAPSPPALPRPACRGRLSIGFQIDGGQLQGIVEIACRTDTVQALTTLGWAGRVDAVSRRLLTDALRTAAHPGNPGRLPVFAAAARDLFKHASQTLAPHPRRRSHRRARHPARDRPSGTFIAEAGAESDALHDDLLSPELDEGMKGRAAIDALRRDARLRPRVTVTDRAAVRLVNEALSALQGLYALFGSYLEHALRPLEPHISREAVRAFILETRDEVDALAACHTLGDLYLESLTITAPGDSPISLEVEASLGAAGPWGSGPDVPHGRRRLPSRPPEARARPCPAPRKAKRRRATFRSPHAACIGYRAALPSGRAALLHPSTCTPLPRNEDILRWPSGV